MRPKETILAIPDLHAPFEHQDAYDFLKEVKGAEKPTEIVCVGDEIDAHALGDYDHDPDGMSAGDEMLNAINSLKPLYKLFPDVRVCTSNHTARPYRRAFSAGIPRMFLREYGEFLQAPKGWQWADSWEVDGIIFEHGEGFSGRDGAIKAALANMNSTVIGHLHSWAGVQYAANPKHLVFGFNVGCLIDKDKYAFAYGKKLKNKPIIGVGIIKEGVPRFLPMQLDKWSRWTGKL